MFYCVFRLDSPNRKTHQGGEGGLVLPHFLPLSHPFWSLRCSGLFPPCLQGAHPPGASLASLASNQENIPHGPCGVCPRSAHLAPLHPLRKALKDILKTVFRSDTVFGLDTSSALALWLAFVGANTACLAVMVLLLIP